MSQSTSATPLYGTSDLASEEAILAMFVRNRIMKLRTSLPVRVESVTNNGGLSPIGYVSILPLVQQVDGEGEAINHGIINNVPYLRIQGGSNAVIIDPEVGDIGMAWFADRDMSAVKASEDQAPPGSKRHHNMSDAVYAGTIIAPTPTQYVQFNDDGISVVSPTRVRVEAPVTEIESPTMTFTGELTFNGQSTFNGLVTATQGITSTGGSGVSTTGPLTNNGVDVGSTHTHDGVEPGTGTSGTPT